MTAGVIEYEGKPAIIATLFDITDRKRAEEEKVNLYEDRIAEEKRHLMEKEKLLMDLHDGIGGITTNIGILVELARKATDIEGVKSTLNTISRLSREGISEIRSFMHSLDTRELNWRSLATELRSQGTNMVEPHRIAFALEVSLEDIQEQPGSLLWVNLFKIYKEALTNVIKHSKADSVAVALKVAKDGLLLIVHDNGTGWEEGRGNGRGISNMKKRAKETGGRLTLTFGRGSGTRVSLEIPLPLKYPVQGMAL
jgi:signal transduction histidine kinase